MGGPQAPLSCKHLELKLRGFIAGHIVAMVTYCAKKSTVTYSAMIGQIRVVIMTLKNLRL